MISQLYEKRLRGDLFKVSIASLITVVIWVGIATYRAFTEEDIKVDVKKQIKTLTPTLDVDTIDNIKQRQAVPEEDWDSLGAVAPEILVVPELDASPSAQQATESASIEE
ncbi:hypothetical protein ACFL18_01925 [Patescibacteria group bacterium]